MIMSRRISYKIFLTVAVLLAACAGVFAQETAYSAYSPYSIFGVGDLSRQGTAYNRSMGGVGVALRSNRFINIVNPAAVTARDSLAFMADFGIYGDNKIFSQENIKSVNNTFNIGSLAMSFPIWRSSAMMIGITPYSDTGFGSSFKYTDPDVIGNIGNINFTAEGNGSIYKFFAAAGVTFFDRLSLGAELDYYFGKISKTYDTSIDDASYVSISNNTTLQMTAIGGKFGIQYEQPIGDEARLGVGATYSTSANLRGYYQDSRLSVGSAVTEFTVKDNDGKEVTLASLREGKKYVLIDFWASWCNPCRKEIPNLKNLYKLYGDKGFQIVSISIDKKKAEWEKALEEEQLPWPNFLDETGVADLYKVRFVPTMYLIDAQGTLVGENLRGQALADKLKELFQ